MTLTRRLVLSAAGVSLISRVVHAANAKVSAEEAVRNGESSLRAMGMAEFSPDRAFADRIFGHLRLFMPPSAWKGAGPRWEIRDNSLQRLASMAAKRDLVVLDCPDRRLYYQIRNTAIAGANYAVTHAYYDDGCGVLLSYWKATQSRIK